ncbi:MAG: ATP-binding cassette domain-containing protein [Thermodesulfobacteriota bacterium]
MINKKKTKIPVIELNGVTKEYCSKQSFFSKTSTRVIAMNNINLTIRKGEIFGLVGQSGSGKTTMGRLLVKLEAPSKGIIKLNGKPVNNLNRMAMKAYRSKVQMIFQDPYQSLNPHLSISETILEPLIVNKIGDKGSRRSKVINTLDIVGLGPGQEYYNRYPHQLSGGQRQRVAIARAIVVDPEFIVADEPTSMLDATIAIQLFKLLKQIRETYNMAFLFITHNLAAAKYLCDRIAVIHNGVIVETGSTNLVINYPQHPYTKKLIATHPGFNF